MASKDIDIKLKLDAKQADKDLHGISDQLDDLDDPVEIEVTADTGSAETDLKAVDDAADQIDPTIAVDVTVDTDKAESNLKTLGEKAEDAEKKLNRVTHDDGGGTSLRGNAISDLTGPLGDASSAASDFGGVFDGLGDTVEGFATKMGATSETAGRLGSAIGGLGFVVAAGAAAWTLWSQKQEEARRKAAEHKKAVDDLATAIRKGDREAAVANFHKLYDDAIASAEKFGLKQQDVIKFLSGENDAIPGLTTKWQELQAAREAANIEANRAQAAGETYVNTAAAEAKAFEDLALKMGISREELAKGKVATEEKAKADDHLADTLVGAEDAQSDMNAAVANSISPLDRAKKSAHDLGVEIDTLSGNLDVEEEAIAFDAAITAAMEKAKTKTGLTRQEVIDLEQSVIQAGNTTKQTPFNIKSTVAMVEAGDLQGVRMQVALWYVQNPVSIASKLALPEQVIHGRPQMAGGPVRAGEILKVGEAGVETFVPNTDGVIVPHGQPVGMGAVGGPMTIIQNFPPGISPLAVAKANKEYQRRGGR